MALITEKREEEEALRFILRLLARKGYFSQELRAKLLKRGLSLGSIDRALNLCMAKGYLNDDAERKRVVASEVRKGRGPLLIAAKLQRRDRRGSFDEIQTIDQKAGIHSCLPKLTQKYDPKTHVGRGKLFQALRRRGFETEAILSCLEQKFPL